MAVPQDQGNDASGHDSDDTIMDETLGETLDRDEVAVEVVEDTSPSVQARALDGLTIQRVWVHNQLERRRMWTTGDAGREPMPSAQRDLLLYSLFRTDYPYTALNTLFRAWAPRYALTIPLMENLLEYREQYSYLYHNWQVSGVLSPDYYFNLSCTLGLT